MNGVWSNKWKKALVWFSGYFSFIAFAIVGGYTIVKSDDEDLKKTTKWAFVITLIFACLSGFLTIFSGFASMGDNYYSSSAYDFYDIFSKIVNIARVVVFTVFIIIEFVKKDKVENSKEETTASAK